ncbi:MAG: nicotinate (nicotinamide) nucleotide adenylyltransferase [Firmicutes bacterium]|nr:nicotinate (nicotinamide) nucleotide adenylyltransferase [Bacillota bacterium]
MLSKIVVFGGSFDPIHKGHTSIIKSLSMHFDKVIIVPAFISPFKKNHNYAESNHRLKMIELALKDEGLINQNIELNTHEIDKGTISYTIETIEFLKNKYPNSQIYFCIGTENLPTLNQWKDFEQLNTLVKFFVISRPNLVHDIPKNINAILSPFKGLDTSSSLIKALIAINEHASLSNDSKLPYIFNHLTPSVLDYIQNQNVYPLHKKIGKLMTKFDFNKKRIPHIIGTIKLAINLAVVYNIDANKASLSALLHDIAKYASFVHVKNEKLNIDLSNLHPVVYHAKIGEAIAKQLLKIDDIDILNSIKYHTTKRANMSALEKITALADYLEETRDFENIDNMRQMLFIDLDKTMHLVLDDMIEKLNNKNRQIYYLTREAYDFYK